ncbi:MAG TPA: flagella basal body P-ring formation protein FlgA [Fimbriimonas sp.]|nr:flagella basal body P-ring formation protein FlgA [Fimbriimonas sp.]
MTALLLVVAAAPSGSIKLHVDGDGMFRFARGSQAVYSADAKLITATGVLSTPEGYPLLPQIHVPADGLGLKVEMDGSVFVSGKQVGRIVLASFGQAELQKFGSYWTSNTRSTIGYPGEGVFGVIRTMGGATKAVAPIKPTQQVSSKLTIEVALKTEVEKPHILLGDIATIQGAGDSLDRISNIDLGSTPIFGAIRGISRIYVLASLRHEGIDTDKLNLLCPTGATVVRKGQKIDEAAMVAAATDGVKTRLGQTGDFHSAQAIADLMVPTGDLQFNPIQAVQTNDGYTVNLEIDVDGKMVTRRTVSLISATPTVMIHSGDPLKIRVIKHGAAVEIAGKARGNGKVGGTITVEAESGATFTGILKSPSLVEVKL